jgi:hypothetical protein
MTIDESTAQPKESNLIAPDQTDTIKMINDLFAQAKAARAVHDRDWKTQLDYYLGTQWKNQTAVTDPNRSKPVYNIIRQTIQAQLPILTDTTPGWNVVPANPEDFDFANIMSDLITSWWDTNQMDRVMVDVLLDMMIYDVGYLRCIWDPMAKDGIGDIIVTAVDPMDIYTPFGASDFDKNCPYVIHRMLKTVGDLRSQFTDKAHLIKPDGKKSDDESLTRSAQTSYIVTPTNQKGFNTAQNDGAQGDIRSTCEVWEIWLDDLTTLQEETDDGQGNKQVIHRKKYPKGRLIVFCPNLKLILSDGEQPYNHRLKPFVRFTAYNLSRSLIGEGVAKPLMNQQRILNRVFANLLDYNYLMSNPTIITEAGNGIEIDDLTNQVSQILQVNTGAINTIRKDYPPALQAGILDLMTFLARQAENLSGLTDASQGRRPQGVTAAAAIETLQEASQTRIRLMERMMAVSLGQLGNQVSALIMQYYTEPRVVRITGEENSWPTYFEFFTEPQEDGSVSYNKKPYEYDEANKRYVPGEYTVGGPTKGTFDIKVLSGTALPVSKSQRANIAFRLFDTKAIDDEELLKTLEWPNAEKILSRMKQPQGEPGPQGV